MAPPVDKHAQATDEPSSDLVSGREGAPATELVPSRDTEPTNDTLPDADVSSTDLSLQHVTGATLLSNAEPATESQNQLETRVRELELKQDELLARVRLLEKGGENRLPRPGIWLLFLPLVAFLWWLAQRLS